jgi:hypothetical protein
MRKYLMTFLLMFLVFGIYQASAQKKQEIPKDFFMGRWGGTISGEVVDKQPHTPIRRYPFNMELVGNPAKLGIGPFGGGAEVWMKMDATWPGKFTLVDTSVGCLLTFGPDYPIFTICYPVSDPASIAEMGYSGVFYLAGFTVQVENKNLILLTSEGTDPQLWEDSWAKGELHRIYVKKDTLGKTVQINEPIKTDQFTQREIVIPAVIEAPEFPYKIGELYVFNNTNCVFTSKNELYLETGEVVVFEDVNWKNIDMDKVVSWKPETDIDIDEIIDEIIEKLDKLHEEGYNFKVRTPQSVLAVRGTQFKTKVEKDGTTILTVLDGEVEFSDKQMRKTVVVKKNQKSVVKSGGLPSDPVSIVSNQIPRWWE